MNHTANQTTMPYSAVAKIKNALDFIRNQKLKVPFISLYRNEFVKPELSTNDLWQVYEYDGKWSQLLARRQALLTIYEKVSNDRLEKSMEDLFQISTSQTQRELTDASAKFTLYYFRDESIPKHMRHWMCFGYDDIIFDLYRRAEILGISKRIGLTPSQFASNLEASDRLYVVEQKSIGLSELAGEYIKETTPKTVDAVLAAAKFVVSREIAREPQLKKSVRETVYRNAFISTASKKEEHKEIDENHCLIVKNKLVRDLDCEEFLRLVIAEQENKLKICISVGSQCKFVEKAKSLYQSDESSENAQEWNKFRADCVSEALNEVVFPAMQEELKLTLLNEAKEFVLNQCCRKLHNLINVTPYKVECNSGWDSSKGIRSMGLAYVTDHTQAAFCAVINGDFELTSYLHVQQLNTDSLALKTFIGTQKPHVIVIGGESCEAVILKQFLQKICLEVRL